MAKNRITISLVPLVLLFSLLGSGAAVAQNSIYQDVKAKQVGDIITVVLRESTSGSSTSDSKLKTSTDGSAKGGVAGNFLPFQPTFGADANVDYGSDERNLSTQRQLLEGFISVQITEVTPGGDLMVEGKRMTEVNGEVHKMSLSGTVRQNDVNSQNQVFSYRIANANISYQKMGGLQKKKKNRGLIKKIVFTGLGVGLGAAILLRQLNN